MKGSRSPQDLRAAVCPESGAGRCRANGCSEFSGSERSRSFCTLSLMLLPHPLGFRKKAVYPVEAIGARRQVGLRGRLS